MNQRPTLNKHISAEDFKAFYWLKEELIQFCKAEELSRQGGKIDLTNRIEHYLKTGEKKAPTQSKKTKAQSSFDWKNEVLSLQTLITDNYKNSENVRAFFQSKMTKKFKFNIKFMAWMKTNTGKTLGNALAAWHQIELEKKKNKQAKEIAPQFEYNTYIRDFLVDNPGESKATAIQYWKIKRAQRGDNIYRKSDLK